MKSPSLDKFYSEIDKHILLAQSYTEIPELSFIIRGCRLKPHDLIFGSRIRKVVLHRHWIDEFGNSLLLVDKKAKILEGNVSLDLEKIISTDLYYGLSLDRIIKVSKLLYLSAGRDQEASFLIALGLDNYLRSYLHWDGKWSQVSPLVAGLEILQALARHADMKYFASISSQKKCPLACQGGEEWLTCLPAPNGFLKIIKDRYSTLYPILCEKDRHE